MTHVDERLLAAVVARFGRPAEWDGSRGISDGNAVTIRSSSDPTRAHDVTFVIENGASEIVLIRKPLYPPGVWRIPSGGVVRGENFEDGVRREALEETGLEVRLTGYPLMARSTFVHRAGRETWTTHVVTAEAAGVLEPRDRREIAAARWGSWDELTGEVATALRGTGSPLFGYRADLHDQIAGLLQGAETRTLEG